MAELPGLEHDPAEWAMLRERHRSQDEALERFLRLMEGIVRNFDRLYSDIGTLHRGVRELDRQRAALDEPGRATRSRLAIRP